MMKSKKVWRGIRKSFKRTTNQYKSSKSIQQFREDYLFNIRKYFNPSIQKIKITNLKQKNKLKLDGVKEKLIQNSSSLLPQASVNNKNLSNSFLPLSITPQQIKYTQNNALLGFSAINLINSELKQSRISDDREPNTNNNSSMKILLQKSMERKNTDDNNITQNKVKQSTAFNNMNSSYHITEEIDSSSQSDQKFIEFNGLTHHQKSFVRQCNGDDNTEIQFSQFRMKDHLKMGDQRHYKDQNLDSIRKKQQSIFQQQYHFKNEKSIIDQNNNKSSSDNDINDIYDIKSNIKIIYQNEDDLQDLPSNNIQDLSQRQNGSDQKLQYDNIDDDYNNFLALEKLKQLDQQKDIQNKIQNDKVQDIYEGKKGYLDHKPVIKQSSSGKLKNSVDPGTQQNLNFNTLFDFKTNTNIDKKNNDQKDIKSNEKSNQNSDGQQKEDGDLKKQKKLQLFKNLLSKSTLELIEKRINEEI